MNRSERANKIRDLQLERSAVGRLKDKKGYADDDTQLELEKFRGHLATARQAVVFERRIGESDLLRVNYLERGLRASRAVCRIDVRNANGSSVADGTGFMISPRLLMTNAHVLLDMDEASNSLAEFDFEDDVNSFPKVRRIFSLRGDEFFFRDEKFDVAVVCVAPTDIRGVTGLDTYGHIALRESSGKALPNEHVSIIQHPNGRSKEIACRANKVLKRIEIYIQYATDTDPGSSGSPVFSDEWELVALHHAGVYATNDNGDILNKNDKIWTAEEGEDQIKWVANEGIRVSEIIARLNVELKDAERKAEQSETERKRFEYLSQAVRQSSIGAAPYVSTRSDIAQERRNAAWYVAAESHGYEPGFMGDEAVVPLPDHSSHPDASPELKYRHFSVVMNQSRRQALFTACNIDGLLRVSSSKDAGWKTDPRLDTRFQLPKEFYEDQSGRTNFLDRGHLVKRTDPSWGGIGEEAIDDTFHFTNAALQHRSFNNGIWGRLEDALEGRFVDRTIMTVFTGPVFHDNDPEAEVFVDGIEDRARIPLEFWKVIAFADADGFFVTAGFRQSQAALIRDFDADFTDEADVQDLIAHQVPIREIELLTGLGFHDLADFEATDAQLEARGDRWRREIRRASDFLIHARPGTRRPTRMAEKRRRKKARQDKSNYASQKQNPEQSAS